MFRKFADDVLPLCRDANDAKAVVLGIVGRFEEKWPGIGADALKEHLASLDAQASLDTPARGQCLYSNSDAQPGREDALASAATRWLPHADLLRCRLACPAWCHALDEQVLQGPDGSLPPPWGRRIALTATAASWAPSAAWTRGLAPPGSFGVAPPLALREARAFWVGLGEALAALRRDLRVSWHTGAYEVGEARHRVLTRLASCPEAGWLEQEADPRPEPAPLPLTPELLGQFRGLLHGTLGSGHVRGGLCALLSPRAKQDFSVVSARVSQNTWERADGGGSGGTDLCAVVIRRDAADGGLESLVLHHDWQCG